MCFIVVFAQIAVAIGVLTSSLGVRDRECGRKGVAEGVTWGVPDVGCPGVVGSPCGWEVSRRVLCGVSLVVFDRGFGWEVLCWEVAWRVSGGV